MPKHSFKAYVCQRTLCFNATRTSRSSRPNQSNYPVFPPSGAPASRGTSASRARMLAIRAQRKRKCAAPGRTPNCRSYTGSLLRNGRSSSVAMPSNSPRTIITGACTFSGSTTRQVGRHVEIGSVGTLSPNGSSTSANASAYR